MKREHPVSRTPWFCLSFRTPSGSHGPTTIASEIQTWLPRVQATKSQGTPLSSLPPLGSPPPRAIPLLVAFPHSLLSLSATNLDLSVPIVLDDRPIASTTRLGLCDG
jgi:hypothetical protein